MITSASAPPFSRVLVGGILYRDNHQKSLEGSGRWCGPKVINGLSFLRKKKKKKGQYSNVSSSANAKLQLSFVNGPEWQLVVSFCMW